MFWGPPWPPSRWPLKVCDPVMCWRKHSFLRHGGILVSLPRSFYSLQTYASQSALQLLDSGLLSFCIEISSVKDCKIGSFNQKQKYTSWSHLLVNSQAAGKKSLLFFFSFNRSMFLIHKNSISCQWGCVFPGTWLLPIHLPPASLERLPHSRAPLRGAGGGAGASVRLCCLLLESQWLRAPSLTSRKPSPTTSSLLTASSGSFPVCPHTSFFALIKP